MFIIFGSPRSGTTLLKEALNQNPGIIIPHETDFIVPCAFIIDRVRDADVGRDMVARFIVSTNDFSPSIGRYLSVAEVRECVYEAEYNLSSILNAIYARIAVLSGALISGDKSPNDLGSVGAFAKGGVFSSDVKIIHIVRDVRDVVLSLQETSWASSTEGADVSAIWNNTNLNLRKFLKSNPTNYFFLRYEDFVASPELLLQQLCSFLDVPFSSAMLDWQQQGRDLRHLPHHKNLGSPPIASRCFGWKRIGNADDFKWAHRANEALQLFGYESSTP